MFGIGGVESTPSGGQRSTLFRVVPAPSIKPRAPYQLVVMGYRSTAIPLQGETGWMVLSRPCLRVVGDPSGCTYLVRVLDEEGRSSLNRSALVRSSAPVSPVTRHPFRLGLAYLTNQAHLLPGQRTLPSRDCERHSMRWPTIRLASGTPPRLRGGGFAVDWVTATAPALRLDAPAQDREGTSTLGCGPPPLEVILSCTTNLILQKRWVGFDGSSGCATTLPNHVPAG